MKFTNSLRTSLYTTVGALLLTLSSFAQAPEKMSYQAVIRGANNALVTNQQVGMQISILQGSTAVYEETQTPTSNTNGLVSLEIGTGTVISGSFTAIDWSAGTYFIKTETDPTGGTNYTITGTSQLLSVPFALYATTSGDGITTDQSDAIVLNTAKVGITSAQANEIVANTAKVGITAVQAIAITANTAKVGFTDVLVSANTAVAANTLKVSYTQPIYSVNTFYAELGGYVIQISPNGKHGLVVAMQDQGVSEWYEANDLLSDPSKHDADGKEFLDWRIPTKRELNLMYVQRATVGNFTNNDYWSSTEYANSDLAWKQLFSYGFQNVSSKSHTKYVRAVRAF